MAKRFYLATQKDSSAKAAPLLEALKAQSWDRTFVWSSQDNVSPDEYAKIAVAELTGVREADVLVEDFGPGAAEGFGLGYAQLRSANQRLIYCTITPFVRRRTQRQRWSFPCWFPSRGWATARQWARTASAAS